MRRKINFKHKNFKIEKNCPKKNDKTRKFQLQPVINEFEAEELEQDIPYFQPYKMQEIDLKCIPFIAASTNNSETSICENILLRHNPHENVATRIIHTTIASLL